jgi:hypothetical protein
MGGGAVDFFAWSCATVMSRYGRAWIFDYERFFDAEHSF